MDSENSARTAESSVDYDFPPVAEIEADGTQYRVDPGFRGTIAVSSRAAGTWSWTLLAEGRWDGIRLKAKPLERALVAELEKALRAASEPTD
jgi:hypothetical protein